MFDRKEVAGLKYGNCLIDLHLHLDGSLSPDIIRKLSRLQNETCTLNDQELEERLMVSEDCKSLDEYLEKFNIFEYKNTYVNKLSKGTKQKVFITENAKNVKKLIKAKSQKIKNYL